MGSPWMPMYWADYLADTGHLTTLQHGAYLLLIAHYWRNQHLPTEEAQLARIARMDNLTWSRNRDIIADLFGDDWTHDRIEQELEKTRVISCKRSASAHAKHSKRNANADQLDTQSQSQSQSKKVHDASRHQETSEVVPIDEAPRAKLFREGKTILVSLGVSEKQSGSILGRWLKQQNDPEGILAALNYAAKHGVMEPIGYVTRCLTKDASNEKLSLADQAKRMAERARDLERTAGIERPPISFGGFRSG